MLKSLRRLFERMNLKDVGKMALAGEFLSSLLDEYLDVIFEKNPSLKKPSEEEMDKIRDKVLKEMQEKYPNAGIIVQKKEK